MTLSDEVVERLRAQPKGQRRDLRNALQRRVGEQVGHRDRSIVRAMASSSPRHEQAGLEDEFAPILPGPGGSDYERYLRTDELLALQKTADEQSHHDELLFQTVHQSSELWLKLAWSEVEAAANHLQAGEI